MEEGAEVGQFWTPIRAIGGSLLHADSQISLFQEHQFRILKGEHSHDHETHDHHHLDLNQRSAYLHVVADAATSLLAILALTGGKLWGTSWLDPVMGIVGACLVAVWAYGLLRDTGSVLLDAEMNAPVVQEIREVIIASPITAHISDLHVWQVGKGKFACILSLVTKDDVDPEYFKRQLSVHEELIHVSVEINRCAF